MKTRSTPVVPVIALTALTALSGLLSGCGKQAFQVSEAAIAQVAPGSYTIPAKVDIVLAQDDTGGILEINQEIQREIPRFLERLENSGWDYRFVLMPLTQVQNITQIGASRFDGNWDRVNQWKSPYPGANPYDNLVQFSLFRSIGYVSGLPTFSLNVNPNNAGNGQEPALDSISRTLRERLPTTQFLRSDALLSVIAISNGEDTSRVSMCRRIDGLQVPCYMIGQAPIYEGIYDPDTKNQNYYGLHKEILSVKSSPELLRFFSVTAKQSTGGNLNCRGSAAFRGQRYEIMSSITGGMSFDVCVPNSIQLALDGISQNLSFVRQSYETKYLIIDATTEPEPSSIQVTKILADGSRRTVSADPVNGFVYEGGPKYVYTIDKPIPMNRQYGYVIRLNGAARLVGSETATISFRAKGASDSN